MKRFLAAAVFGLLLTPGLAWAGDEGGSEVMPTCAAGYELINAVCFPRTVPDAGSETEAATVMTPAAVAGNTSSSAGGILVPLILLALIAAAAAN